MPVHVHLRSPEWDFVVREQLSRVDTKHGLRGKAFGSFAPVMREDAPFTIQPWNQLVWSCNKPTGEGLSFSTFGRGVARKRNTSTA